MARFVYAKIYCDILRHPLLRDRPDSDVRLALGLILEAKEHTEDGVLRRLTAESARGLCHIKAPLKKVQEGIDYLVSEGWLIPHPDQAYEIKDFIDRQGKTDTPEAQAVRAKNYYEIHRETILEKRRVSRAVSRENSRENEHRPREKVSRSSHAEVEGEEEVETKTTASAGAIAPPAPTTAVWSAYSKAYEVRYGASPVRNAKVNGQLAQMLKRLPESEAPAVAEFYLAHGNALYVRSGHAIDLLLRDCEKLRTEWFTGRRITATEARQQDQTQANVDGWEQLRRRDAVVK